MSLPEQVEKACKVYREALYSEIDGEPSVHSRLKVQGMYLYGSVALGDYQDGGSDIDFVTVVARPPAERDVDVLRLVHRRVRKACPRAYLNGIYVTPDQLGQLPPEMEPVVSYSDGIFELGYFDINPVTWYELKETGITVFGPEISTLDLQADIGQVREYVFENINSYWRHWAANGRRPMSLIGTSLLFRKQAEWGILGVTRQYVTVTENKVVSKTEAGEYALRAFPEWSRVINEALYSRKGMRRTEYRNPFRRRRDILAYMDMVIDKVNGMAVGEGFQT